MHDFDQIIKVDPIDSLVMRCTGKISSFRPYVDTLSDTKVLVMTAQWMSHKKKEYEQL
jgi:hypothetical protein